MLDVGGVLLPTSAAVQEGETGPWWTSAQHDQMMGAMPLPSLLLQLLLLAMTIDPNAPRRICPLQLEPFFLTSTTTQLTAVSSE